MLKQRKLPVVGTAQTNESLRRALFWSHRHERLDHFLHFFTIAPWTVDFLCFVFFDGQHFAELSFAIMAAVFVDGHILVFICS